MGSPELLLLLLLLPKDCSPDTQYWLCVSSTAGVRFIEEDVVRYHTAGGRAHMDTLLAGTSTGGPTRKLQQVQPYGLAAVQATSFTTVQRSTTSSENPAAKFPICIIGGSKPCGTLHPHFTRARVSVRCWHHQLCGPAPSAGTPGPAEWYARVSKAACPLTRKPARCHAVTLPQTLGLTRPTQACRASGCLRASRPASTQTPAGTAHTWQAPSAPAQREQPTASCSGRRVLAQLAHSTAVLCGPTP